MREPLTKPKQKRLADILQLSLETTFSTADSDKIIFQNQSQLMLFKVNMKQYLHGAMQIDLDPKCSNYFLFLFLLYFLITSH